MFRRVVCPLSACLLAVAIAAPAQTFKTLLSFDNMDGETPNSALIQATDGKLYGTTYYGGAHGYGTVFKLTTSGAMTTLYSFCSESGCMDGSYPTGLIQATDGNFYGTTQLGGASSCSGEGCGTVFKITPSGTLTSNVNFQVLR